MLLSVMYVLYAKKITSNENKYKKQDKTHNVVSLVNDNEN